MDLMHEIKKTLHDTLFPESPSCPICRRVVFFKNAAACEKCMSKIKPIDHNSCSICAAPLDQSGTCCRCSEHRFAFDGGISLWQYDDTSKQIIYDFKYQNNPDTAKACGRLLAEKLLTTPWINQIDALIAVPVSPATYATRGYNQTQFIADEISRICDIILYNQILFKKDGVKDQTELTPQERYANVADAYYLAEAGIIQGKSLLIIDDVITTGATLKSISGVLKSVGAGAIYIATVATAVY